MRLNDLFARIEAEHPEIAEIAHEVDPPYILATNVIQIRERNGMTREQLAEKIGEPPGRILKVERGDSNPRLVTLSRISHALGVSLSELLEDNLHGPNSDSASHGETESRRSA